MSTLRRLIDPYLLMLIATVAIAAVLPARGEWAVVAEWVTTAAVALLFFLYGARLSPAAIWAGLSHWRLQSMVFASTFVLFPLIGLAVNAVFGRFLAPEIAVGLLYLSLLPSTVQSSIAFTSIARGNVPAALCSASLSNLLGVVLTPLLVTFLLPGASGGISLKAVEDISLQILLPFVLGQAARPLIGAFLSRHAKLVGYVDRGSILLVVYAAFSAGMVAGIWGKLDVLDLGLVFLLNILVLGAVMVTLTIASRRLGFSKEDEIAIVFCGSKKGMVSGIPMAAILFAGQAVSLIVLPLMLFHQIQLFVCAVLARRYAERPEGEPAPVKETAELPA
ncbi:bile acid:sodium symporter family protein [Brevundimonas goettingensis]|uniref:Bile acid:sodium symporter n=1 Tax=Brevundimonas goettingensis TaxID=2774190 RepID=A0A975GWG3_9CAUL|nr:bile acid:sodium symporter family protein [Brevundimonas goettingensis]QTC92621.1 bile acid:sodium symporter [Brevundimonas goettingensis]